MFDKKKFEAAMKLADKTYKDLAIAMDIDISTLYRKVNGISEFTRVEIQTLCELLNLDNPVAIFFSNEVA